MQAPPVAETYSAEGERAVTGYKRMNWGADPSSLPYGTSVLFFPRSHQNLEAGKSGLPLPSLGQVSSLQSMCSYL